MSTSNKVYVLHDGYSELKTTKEAAIPIMRANCTCVLIRNAIHNVVIDSMTPWDTQKIKDSLKMYNLGPDQIDFVVSTHGHSDHVGNNNLFLNATHVVGFSVSKGDEYYLHPFDKGVPFLIGEKNSADKIEIIPTPGHTMDSVSLVVNTKDNKTVVIAGDLFEKEADLKNHQVWIDAGSEDKHLQEFHRIRMLDIADYIIPGHGPMFKVTDDIIKSYHKLS